MTPFCFEIEEFEGARALGISVWEALIMDDYFLCLCSMPYMCKEKPDAFLGVWRLLEQPTQSANYQDHRRKT